MISGMVYLAFMMLWVTLIYKVTGLLSSFNCTKG